MTGKSDEKQPDDLDMRRKRAAYRAAHRGTKEMDALVGRYADAKLSSMNDAPLSLFERFLQVPEPTLQAWLFANQSAAGTDFEALVIDIRTFHGLVGLTPDTGHQ
ncbi:MAG: succinate dehydrogenase assembly factor 2 [Hyphomicrobium sp.]|nr:succinate dehydrogenase assembly factor 2 [Hyphomicrobium sp.]